MLHGADGVGPSSTNKCLLPVFESHHGASDRDVGKEDETPSSREVSKRLKFTETDNNGSSSSNIATSAATNNRLVLPHQTPIGKYLPSSHAYADGCDCAATSTSTTPVIVTPKRMGYLGWDDYFLGVAILSSKRSKDPDHAEGACIADSENRIVAIGYNGFPRGCPDTIFPWHDYNKKNSNKDDEDDDINTADAAATMSWLHSKQPYVCSAITNAILNKCSQDVTGCRLYVMEFPTSDCVKVMIQSGIRELIILKRKGGISKIPHSDDEHASRIMLDMANITVRYWQPSVSSVTLDFGDSTNSDATKSTVSPPPPSPALEFTFQEQVAANVLREEATYDALTVVDNGRRADSISWKDYFMSVAFLTAQRSKDPNTQVGACIVDDENRIIGLGYNGMPRGLSDDAMPWARQNANPLFNKYLYVTHAEVNAILNKGSANVKGAAIYVALFPCENCAKMIIQSGIRKVVYLRDLYHDTDGCRASRIMFTCANVELEQYTPTMQKMFIDYCSTASSSCCGSTTSSSG